MLEVKIHRLKNKSSQVKQDIGYNEKEKTLMVTFTSGGTYLYTPVTKGVLAALIDSESAGSFINKNLAKKEGIKVTKLHTL